ncbi:hypothetical protein L6R52_38905, partial [Myxococcota bacterium]|nr:hypothetical protein [Myxococcota bacterium]
FVIDTNLCALGQLRGAMGALGELCFEPSEQLGTCDGATTEPPALASLVCSGGLALESECHIDVLSEAPEPPLAITTLELDDPPYFDDHAFSRPSAGYLADLAVLDGLVAVVGWGAPPRVSSAFGCDGVMPAKLYRVDPETMRLVGTSTLPPCVAALTPDPLGDGFLAVHGLDEPVVTRFDRLGRAIEHVAYDEGVLPGIVRPVAITTMDGDPPIAVALLSEDLSDDLPAHVFVVDLRTMTKLPMETSPGLIVKYLFPFDGRELLAPDISSRTVRFLDPRRGTVRDGPTLVGTVPGTRIGEVVWLPAAQRFLATGDSQSGGIYAFLPTHERTGRAAPYERYAEVFSIGPWPTDPMRALTVVLDFDLPRNAWAMLVDARAPQMLPGATPIGLGTTGDLVPAGDRVFTILPWSSTLVRIAPTR